MHGQHIYGHKPRSTPEYVATVLGHRELKDILSHFLIVSLVRIVILCIMRALASAMCQGTLTESPVILDLIALR